MKINFLLLFTFLLSASCTSREQLASAQFTAQNSEIGATLYSEDFLNADGLVRRTVQIDLQDGATSDWEIHTAHYSDKVNLKVLIEGKHAYLIAEDNTGYSVWDLQHNKVVAERGIGESGNLAESGTARDYMVHTPLNKEQWTKILGLNTSKEHSLTTINWDNNTDK